MEYEIKAVIKELKQLSEAAKVTYPVPTMEDIQEVEESLRKKFSEEYKYFLKEITNVMVNTLEPFVLLAGSKSLRLDPKSGMQEAWKMGVPKDWLPICEDNSNYYCLLEDGTVRFWSHDGTTDEKWENLAHWIKDVWIDEN